MRIGVTARVAVTRCNRLDTLQKQLAPSGKSGAYPDYRKNSKKTAPGKTVVVFCSCGLCLGEATAKKLAHKAWVQEAISLSQCNTRALRAVEQLLTPDLVPCSIYIDRGLNIPTPPLVVRERRGRFDDPSCRKSHRLVDRLWSGSPAWVGRVQHV